MTSLGFENYSEALKIYLSKYREVGVPQQDARRCHIRGLEASQLTASCSSLSPIEMRTNRTDRAAKEAMGRREVRLLRVLARTSRLGNWEVRVLKAQRPTTCTARRELVPERAIRRSPRRPVRPAW